MIKTLILILNLSITAQASEKVYYHNQQVRQVLKERLFDTDIPKDLLDKAKSKFEFLVKPLEYYNSEYRENYIGTSNFVEREGVTRYGLSLANDYMAQGLLGVNVLLALSDITYSSRDSEGPYKTVASLRFTSTGFIVKHVTTYPQYEYWVEEGLTGIHKMKGNNLPPFEEGDIIRFREISIDKVDIQADKFQVHTQRFYQYKSEEGRDRWRPDTTTFNAHRNILDKVYEFKIVPGEAYSFVDIYNEVQRRRELYPERQYMSVEDYQNLKRTVDSSKARNSLLENISNLASPKTNTLYQEAESLFRKPKITTNQKAQKQAKKTHSQSATGENNVISFKTGKPIKRCMQLFL